MDEIKVFLDHAVAAVNLPYTILLGIAILYWISVCFGVLDMGLFDVDLDVDLDVDADIDAGVDAGGAGQAVVAFLGMDTLPVMFYLSIVSLVSWIGSMQINYQLNNRSIWLALAIAIPNLVFALLVAKFISIPFRWMQKVTISETKLDGMTCLVTTSEITSTFGECEITTDDTTLKILARTEAEEVLHKGEAAVVVRRLPADNTYIVTKKSGEN